MFAALDAEKGATGPRRCLEHKDNRNRRNIQSRRKSGRRRGTSIGDAASVAKALEVRDTGASRARRRRTRGLRFRVNRRVGARGGQRLLPVARAGVCCTPSAGLRWIFGWNPPNRYIRAGEGEGCHARGERPGAEALAAEARAYAEGRNLRSHSRGEREMGSCKGFRRVRRHRPRCSRDGPIPPRRRRPRRRPAASAQKCGAHSPPYSGRARSRPISATRSARLEIPSDARRRARDATRRARARRREAELRGATRGEPPPPPRRVVECSSRRSSC